MPHVFASILRHGGKTGEQEANELSEAQKIKAAATGSDSNGKEMGNTAPNGVSDDAPAPTANNANGSSPQKASNGPSVPQSKDTTTTTTPAPAPAKRPLLFALGSTTNGGTSGGRTKSSKRMSYRSLTTQTFPHTHGHGIAGFLQDPEEDEVPSGVLSLKGGEDGQRPVMTGLLAPGSSADDSDDSTLVAQPRIIDHATKKTDTTKEEKLTASPAPVEEKDTTATAPEAPSRPSVEEQQPATPHTPPATADAKQHSDPPHPKAVAEILRADGHLPSAVKRVKSRATSADGRGHGRSSSVDRGGRPGTPLSAKGSLHGKNHKYVSKRTSMDVRSGAVTPGGGTVTAGGKREYDLKERERREKELMENDPARARYGPIQHSGRTRTKEMEGGLAREKLELLNESRVGDTVLFRARIHGSRAIGSKLAFIVLRDGLFTIQAVLRRQADEDAEDGGVSESMVRWAERLPRETLVLCEGVVRKPEEESKGEQQVVKTTAVHGAEIEVHKMWVLSQVTEHAPFAVAQAERRPPNKVEEEKQASILAKGEADVGRAPRVGFSTQLEHRVLSLRTPTANAIFKIVAAVSRAARHYLDERQFTEIHSAKLQAGATESGSSVFNVDYFRRKASLAQSPQLAKEMCVGSDFEKVYEIGPVFRAENSNTHRHLCEFTGLDVEMVIDLDYHEAMWAIDGMLKHIFRTVLKQNRAELEAVKRTYPHEDLVFPEKTVVINFKDGVRMLRESGYRDEGEDEGCQDDMDDLSTRAEVRLGQLVKAKYNTDYYILDKFPLVARPFYTMPDAEDPKYSNSFDIFVRGEEILSGGQRLHSAVAMAEALDRVGIPHEQMREYLEAFQYAMPPHAGGGIGLQRLVMLFLQLGNIRHATLFPRDPKSFLDNEGFNAPGKPVNINLVTPKGVAGWEEPDSLSKDPMFVEGEHAQLTDLVAKYGDSTNTAWTDSNYEIWRESRSGFAIGFVRVRHHVVIWGPPLCPPKEISRVIKAFVRWCKETRVKPVWSNADDRTETVLAKELNWRALAVTSEQRLAPRNVDPRESKPLERKLRQAESHGVTVKKIEGVITRELRAEVDEGMQRWLESREGAQIHTTSLRPWSDVAHRTYFLARDKNKKVCGLIVLHKLAPEHGFQVKWSLSFPDAPNGTPEILITSAMKELSDHGVQTATFGAGARDSLDAVHGIGRMKSRILSDIYKGISKTFGLTRKSHFREKFGANEDSLYVCYPKNGLGLSGIRALMDSVKN